MSGTMAHNISVVTEMYLIAHFTHMQTLAGGVISLSSNELTSLVHRVYATANLRDCKRGCNIRKRGGIATNVINIIIEEVNDKGVFYAFTNVWHDAWRVKRREYTIAPLCALFPIPCISCILIL
jgi:hypothetical protein